MIQACPVCASTDLRLPGLADGMVPETDNLQEWVCRRCGTKATPLEFDDPRDHAAFQAQRRAAGPPGEGRTTPSDSARRGPS